MKLSQSCPQASVFTTSRVLNQIRVGKSPDSAGWSTSRSKSQLMCCMQEPFSLSLCWSVVIWGHLYCTRPGLLHGDASQHLLPIGQESAQPSYISMPPQEYIFSGTAHRLTSPHRPALSAIQWDWLREVSKHFHIRGPPPKHTHAW